MACLAGKRLDQRHTIHCQVNQAQQRKKGKPDISRLKPALQLQWDDEAYAHLGNVIIRPTSGLKVQWKCDQCPDGYPHGWESAVRFRTRGDGCPQCSGRKVCQHSSLATEAPWVAAEWDHEANADLGTPDTMLVQSNKPARWRCHSCDHLWVARISSRTSKTSVCPQCAAKRQFPAKMRPTFADRHPRQWDHKRNAALSNFPNTITEGSAKKIFWLCNKCPAGQQHSWSAQAYSRTGRIQSGCPMCAGQSACMCNSLQACYPDVAAGMTGIMPRTQASLVTTLLAQANWPGGPQRQEAAGSRP